MLLVIPRQTENCKQCAVLQKIGLHPEIQVALLKRKCKRGAPSTQIKFTKVGVHMTISNFQKLSSRNLGPAAHRNEHSNPAELDRNYRKLWEVARCRPPPGSLQCLQPVLREVCKKVNCYYSCPNPPPRTCATWPHLYCTCHLSCALRAVASLMPCPVASLVVSLLLRLNEDRLAELIRCGLVGSRSFLFAMRGHR